MNLTDPDPTRGLRLALRVNAVFSSTCALIFLWASASIGAFVGLPPALVIALGLGLLAFAGLLVATSLRNDPVRLRTEARLHCAADLAWVIGSVPIVAFGWLTAGGSTGLMAVSMVVLGLAVAQWRGLSHVHASGVA